MVDKKTVSFIRSLCTGQIEEEVILPFPSLREQDRETLKSVLGSVDQVLSEHAEDFRKWDRKGEFPPEFVEELKQFGLFGLVIPEDHGGLGFGSTAYSRALQQVAKHDASVAVTIGAHSSIGMRGLLLFGTDEQKQRYYPKLATGEMIAAFCLTEPGSGSDAASIKTTAVKDGSDWVINGNKLWITNGGIASFFTVFAKTESAGEKGKMTAFIVTSDMPGVTAGPHEDKMGLRASSTTTVHLDNVRVPAANVLGEEGKGFKVAMKILNSGRTGLGGGAVGAMKSLIGHATKQVKERVQFGKSISEFPLIREKIAGMVVDCYASEAAVSMVAAMIDQGYEDYAVEAAISKVFASEALWRVSDEALQAAGGNGFMCDFPYERVVRDARINRIFEGTNEILRLFIALTAINDVGAQLKELAASLRGAFNDPIKGFGVLSDYALKRAALVTGIQRGKSAFTKLSPALKEHAELFESLTRDLASEVDKTLRRYGREIIGKQLPTKRLAEVMIDLFVLACVISRVNTSLENAGKDAAKEQEILAIFAAQVRKRVKANLASLDDNTDKVLSSVAEHALNLEGYGWDTV